MLWMDVVNAPNAITALRILLIPAVVWFMLKGTPQGGFWAATIYILCAITDALDGWLARRLGIDSVFGKFLDPLADKILVTAILVFLTWMGRLSLLGVVASVLLIVREMSVTSLRAVALSEGVMLAASRGGKDKTALQMVAILLLILHYRYDLYFGFTTLRVDMGLAGEGMLVLSVLLALLSGGDYLRLFAQAVGSRATSDMGTPEPAKRSLRTVKKR